MRLRRAVDRHRHGAVADLHAALVDVGVHPGRVADRDRRGVDRCACHLPVCAVVNEKHRGARRPVGVGSAVGADGLRPLSADVERRVGCRVGVGEGHAHDGALGHLERARVDRGILGGGGRARGRVGVDDLAGIGLPRPVNEDRGRLLGPPVAVGLDRPLPDVRGSLGVVARPSIGRRRGPGVGRGPLDVDAVERVLPGLADRLVHDVLADGLRLELPGGRREDRHALTGLDGRVAHARDGARGGVEAHRDPPARAVRGRVAVAHLRVADGRPNHASRHSGPARAGRGHSLATIEALCDVKFRAHAITSASSACSASCIRGRAPGPTSP